MKALEAAITKEQILLREGYTAPSLLLTPEFSYKGRFSLLVRDQQNGT